MRERIILLSFTTLVAGLTLEECQKRYAKNRRLHRSYSQSGVWFPVPPPLPPNIRGHHSPITAETSTQTSIGATRGTEIYTNRIDVTTQVYATQTSRTRSNKVENSSQPNSAHFAEMMANMSNKTASIQSGINRINRYYESSFVPSIRPVTIGQQLPKQMPKTTIAPSVRTLLPVSNQYTVSTRRPTTLAKMTKETLSPKINEIWSEPNTDDNDDEDEINDIVYIFDDDSTLSPDIDQLDSQPFETTPTQVQVDSSAALKACKSIPVVLMALILQRL